MKTIMFRRMSAAIGMCAVLGGCGAAGDEGSEPTPGSEPAPTLPGASSFEADPDFVTALASVQISNTHRVDFFEIGRGHLLVLEDRHADFDGAGVTNDFNARTDSPVGLYLAIAGDAADQAVVERLTRFESRLAEAKAARAAKGESAAAARSEITSTAAEDMVSKNHSVGFTPPGWNWDADASWFVSNFCELEGLFHCQANMASFNWLVSASSFRVDVFNQSFSETATFRMAYDPCDFTPPWEFCTKPFKTLFTVQPMPRHIVAKHNSGDTTWSANGTGSRFGLALNFF